MELTPEQKAAINEVFHDLVKPENGIEGVHAAIRMWEEHPGLYEAMHTPDPDTGIILRNPGPDANRMTEKMLRNVARSAQDYVQGMQNPKADFKQAALAANGKYKDSMLLAVQEDRFQKGMQGVDSAAAIATATSDNGAAFTSGVAKRKDKIAAAMQRLAPKLGAVSAAVRQLPQNTPEDRMQRMIKNLELMRALKSGSAG